MDTAKLSASRSRVLATRLLRGLTVAEPAAAGALRQISAASGLVRVGEFLYVVADDENHLAVFPAHGTGDGQLIRLFAGDLPDGHKARKARKPDLEALALVPPSSIFPTGALLALPSGSRPNRRIGSVLALDAAGGPASESRAIDFSELYLALEDRFAELNIEGALVLADALVLLQRGSGPQPVNACIRVPFTAIAAAIGGAGRIAKPASIAVRPVDLGDISGTALCFTDAALLPDGRIVFTAVAEAAANSYEDGPCVGAAIGILATDDSVQWLEQLDPPYKIEGVHADLAGDSISLLLVTDADDVSVPSVLRSATIPYRAWPSQLP